MSPENERPNNRLIDETSPYLRQHAQNPVDWYPWCPEALELAKREDRPIFLSVGYSSCHWCHVMERESFEDEDTAALMNAHFVNIKVDREERPDLDSIYMASVQMLTGQGGWPMSVFLTPALKPFFGGTYFPPEPRYGMPSFQQLLAHVAKVYKENRDKVEETATSLLGYLADEPESESRNELDDAPVEAAVAHSRRTFDAQHGGFGAAPKFPRSLDISLLLRVYARTKDQELLAMCERTLDAMALGGLYDQIGGGFHRYSTDAQWLVPHFEKMLYDNALLARSYAEAYQLTKRPLYERIARETLDYVSREMTSPEGGFYSATDADSEGEEGVFFVWTPQQVAEVLGEEDASVVCRHFNITENGNFERNTSIPNVTQPVQQTAQACGISADEAAAILARGRKELYERREQRPKPFRDEKILTSWNSLMVTAFARGARLFREARYLDAAVAATELILTKMTDGDRLLRVRNEGESKIAAFLDDYSYLVEALLELFEASHDVRYLNEAASWMDRAIEHFWDSEAGGFFYARGDDPELIVRRKELLDNATPSGNGVALGALLRLYHMTGRDEYRSRGDELMRTLWSTFEKFPMAMGSGLTALDFHLQTPVEIAIVGKLDDQGTAALLAEVDSTFLPHSVLVVAEGANDAVPLLSGRDPIDGQSTAYVCRQFACREPVKTPEALREQLAAQ